MTPVREYVLVKPFPSDTISDGGIFVPDSCKKISNKVMVIAVGCGTKSKPMKLKPDTIGYRVKDWGDGIIIDGELHFLMTQSSIIAIE